MKNSYHIFHLEGVKTEGVSRKEIGIHPFLPQIEEEFRVYRHHLGYDLYEIFGIHFMLAKYDKKNEMDAICEKCTYLRRKAVICRERVAHEAISKNLRGSSTLRITDGNSYATGHGNLVVFSSHGVHISRERGDNWGSDSLVEDAEKSIACYLLALAYQKKAEELLQRAIAAFDNGQAQGMIDARDALCAFDLKYFFANPVRMEVFETRALWEMAARHCGIQAAHDEIKSQILELATIIENRRRDAEEVRQHRMERKLTLIGLFLSALSLLELLKGFWN